MVRPALSRALVAVCGLAALAAGVAPMEAKAATPFLLPLMFSTQADHMTVTAAQASEAYFVGAFTLRGGKYTLVGPDGARGEPPKVVDMTDLTLIEFPMPAMGTYRLTTGQWQTRATRMAKIDGVWKMVRTPPPPGARQGPPGAPGAPRPAPAPNPRFVDEADLPATAETVTTHDYLFSDVYVSRGNPSDTVMKPTGGGLELIPSHNPTDLFGGDSETFRLTMDGKAAAGAAVTVHAAGNNYQDKIIFKEGVTDADGNFKLTYPPGAYSLKVEYPAPVQRDPAAPPPLNTYTYTVTFEVTR